VTTRFNLEATEPVRGPAEALLLLALAF